MGFDISTVIPVETFELAYSVFDRSQSILLEELNWENYPGPRGRIGLGVERQ